MTSYKLSKFDPLMTSSFKNQNLQKENFQILIHQLYSLPKTFILSINKGWQNKRKND